MAMVGNSSPGGPPQGPQEGRPHLLAGLATLAGGVVLLAAVIFGLTAGVGAIWSSVTSKPAPAPLAAAQGLNGLVASAPATTTGPATTTAPATTAPAAPATTAAPSGSAAESHENDASHVSISLTIKNIKTPGGEQPAYVGPNGVGADTLFSVTSGQSVTVTVKNEDSGFHTFTAANLGLAVTIKPLATTTFSFRPTTAGTYQWKCDIPCGGWVMSHLGYMTGNLDVVAAK